MFKRKHHFVSLFFNGQNMSAILEIRTKSAKINITCTQLFDTVLQCGKQFHSSYDRRKLGELIQRLTILTAISTLALCDELSLNSGCLCGFQSNMEQIVKYLFAALLTNSTAFNPKKQTCNWMTRNPLFRGAEECAESIQQGCIRFQVGNGGCLVGWMHQQVLARASNLLEGPVHHWIMKTSL